MTPAFILLVILSLIILFFLLSFIYRPLGSFIKRIVSDAVEQINKEDNKEN